MWHSSVLDGNRLSGTLLPDKTLAAFTAMLINVERNEISGSLPNVLSDDLISLQLQGNRISGTPYSEGVAHSMLLIMCECF